MKAKASIIVCCVMVWTLMAGMVDILSADDHRKRHRQRTREGRERRGHDAIRPVSNPVYREECGACHFTYQPELLPSASWKKVVTAHDDHFGESVALDDDTEKTILDYLTANGAERSSAKRAVKIMQSLRSDVPSRITDIPYIKRKHREISLSVLKRNSIGSLSNCAACHKTAEEGIYDDDNVTIPK
jgi:Dihaem cytochrome c